MGATQLKSIIGISVLFTCHLALCITNGVRDTETLSVVKLTNKNENALCSGTIVGTNPVTVLTAFHCANMDLNGEIYLDLRPSVIESEKIANIINAINPPKQVDMSMFKDVKPIDLGNGLKFDPSNLPQNGIVTFGGALQIPPPQLQDNWKATKFILSPAHTESKAFNDYEKKLNQKFQVETKLRSTTEKLAALQLKASPLNSNLNLIIGDLSLINQKPKELVDLENQISTLSEELMYISRSLEAKRIELIGNRINKQVASDVMLIVFGNYSLPGTLEDLYKEKKFSPVLADLETLADSNETFSLHGFGKESIFSEGSIKKAERKQSTALNVALEDNEDRGFIKFRGLLKNIASKKFPLGTYGSMIDGDSGGSILKDGALVGVYSQYRLSEVEGEELMPNWPHYHKHTGDSEFLEFFAISIEAEATQSLLEQAPSQGADIVYKDPKSGKLFRKE